MNVDTKNDVVISTAAGKFWIAPYGLSHIDVYDEAGRSFEIEKTVSGWRHLGGSIDRRSAKVLFAAVGRWIVANPSRFHELAPELERRKPGLRIHPGGPNRHGQSPAHEDSSTESCRWHDRGL